MHYKCKKPGHDCYREFLLEDRFGDSRHEEPDQDVGNRLCHEAWWSYRFSRLIHDYRVHHQRWPAATVDRPLLIRRYVVQGAPGCHTGQWSSSTVGEYASQLFDRHRGLLRCPVSGPQAVEGKLEESPGSARGVGVAEVANGPD
jgi:hypothetical protein